MQAHECNETKAENSLRNCTNNQIDESTSYYSSSYSSFLKTDGGSGSNDDSTMPENKCSKKDYVSIENAYWYLISCWVIIKKS